MDSSVTFHPEELFTTADAIKLAKTVQRENCALCSALPSSENVVLFLALMPDLEKRDLSMHAQALLCKLVC